MQILVTGGSGFIGSHLCAKLLEDATNSVIAVDNLLTGDRSNISHLEEDPRFEFINADVINPLRIEKKIDVIFHLASPASPNHHSNISYHALPLETMQVNTTGTMHLLELAEKNNARFLFASTSEVYGDPLEHPQVETYNGNCSTIGPRSVYDEAKRFGETITAYFWRSRNVNARIVRIFNTYGPNMRLDDMRMLVSFIKNASSNKPITIFGDGSQTRSLCYIDDLVDGLIRLMFYSNTNQTVVNLGSDAEFTVAYYAKLIKEMMNSSSEIVSYEKMPENDPKQRRPDITLAEKLLEWKPTTSLEDGLKRTISYYKNII